MNKQEEQAELGLHCNCAQVCQRRYIPHLVNSAMLLLESSLQAVFQGTGYTSRFWV